MRDAECVAFLRSALPRLGLRWDGFRKVRRQVCRRVERRLRALGLDDVAAYRGYLEGHPEEWTQLEAQCRIPISRFFRDRGVFEYLAERGLPHLARETEAAGECELRCWSAGCASGEEPYTLALIWAFQLAPAFPELALRVLGTDVEEHLLERARRACYARSSLHELPTPWLEAAFKRQGELYCLQKGLRNAVELRLGDLREELPGERFHLILCRNMAFTYFDTALQRRVAAALRSRLEPRGLLVLGSHERLPAQVEELAPVAGAPGGIYAAACA